MNLTEMNWQIKSKRRMTKTRRTYFILAAENSEGKTYFINVKRPWAENSVSTMELTAHGEESCPIHWESDLGKLVNRICGGEE